MSTKKGISIGAAMKQRMDKEQTDLQIPETEKSSGMSGGATVKGAEATPDDPLESFNTRLPRSLQRRLKVHVALEGTKIQDVIYAALDEYLAKEEK